MRRRITHVSLPSDTSTKSPEYMGLNCRKSCGVCTPKEPSPCKDAFPTCRQWASQGMCSGFWQGTKGSYTIDAPYIVEMCPESCKVCNIHLDERDWKLGMGFPQSAPELTDASDPQHILHRVKAKVAETAVYMLGLPEEIRPICKFGHINCARLTLNPDTCTENHGHYVYDYLCAAACQTCEKFADSKEREIAQEHFDSALKELQQHMDYQRHLEKKKAREAANH